MKSIPYRLKRKSNPSESVTYAFSSTTHYASYSATSIKNQWASPTTARHHPPKRLQLDCRQVDPWNRHKASRDDHGSDYWGCRQNKLKKLTQWRLVNHKPMYQVSPKPLSSVYTRCTKKAFVNWSVHYALVPLIRSMTIFWDTKPTWMNTMIWSEKASWSKSITI